MNTAKLLAPSTAQDVHGFLGPSTIQSPPGPDVSGSDGRRSRCRISGAVAIQVWMETITRTTSSHGSRTTCVLMVSLRPGSRCSYIRVAQLRWVLFAARGLLPAPRPQEPHRRSDAQGALSRTALSAAGTAKSGWTTAIPTAATAPTRPGTWPRPGCRLRQPIQSRARWVSA